MRLIIFCILFYSIPVTRNDIVLSFYLMDGETMSPVTDAHVFISNSTYVTVSGTNGEVRLPLPEKVSDELIITHLGYHNRILSHALYKNLISGDTVYMEGNGFEINEVVIEQKRGKGWKKNFEKFSRALLGEGNEADDCIILNPEVLRFHHDEKGFKVKAEKNIKVINEHLRYEIDFLLEELNITPDESMRFYGHASFTDKISDNDTDIENRRKEAYKRSLKHFLKALIEDRLEESYKIELVRYENGTFHIVSIPVRENLLFYNPSSGNYHIRFDEFLQISHLNEKEYRESEMGTGSTGLEGQRFNAVNGKAYKLHFMKSWLKKSNSDLIVNPDGNILNKDILQEYGFFADQRLASMLPMDYKSAESANIKDKALTSIEIVENLLYGSVENQRKTIKNLNENWNIRFVPVLLDMLRVLDNSEIKKKISKILSDHIGEDRYYEGLQWLWQQDVIYDQSYFEAKAEIYKHLDPKFHRYFSSRHASSLINLDEVVWGGVVQNGIPPLNYPTKIHTSNADYLNDGNVVFGVVINGEAVAFPKRILGWHEFLIDSVGGIKIACVYCTLCGYLSVFESSAEGREIDLGTSGFLYRSNKLMFDHKTQSLWSSIEGIPVIGPLANKGIKLKRFPVIETKWKAWKQQYPQSRVLNIETGHRRNYDEGEAYKAYYNHDRLMFPVPIRDNRLKNKETVFIPRIPGKENHPIAISTVYLQQKHIVETEVDGDSLLILCNDTGEIRAYEAPENNFKFYTGGRLIDPEGHEWRVEDSFLESPSGKRYDRIASHQIFWFAWVNMYPDTRLIK